ncbi:hypothetical protein REPUB_Repub02eG0117200 [Reevesia pubescens]
MEIFHKERFQDFKTIDTKKYVFSLNGNARNSIRVVILQVLNNSSCDKAVVFIGKEALNMEGIQKLGGGYNPQLQTSLPEEFRCYDPDKETAESSHRAFTTAFPRGFALEILKVYTGPPEIVYKFRHWGYNEGPFKGHAPTGELVEFYGIAIMEVDEEMKVARVEFFYERGELLGGLLKGAPLGSSALEVASSCPFLRNTG